MINYFKIFKLVWNNTAPKYIVKWKWKSFSHVWLFVNPWNSPWSSLGQNTRVGSLLQGILPTQGSKPRSPALQADSLAAEPPGKPHKYITKAQNGRKSILS